MQIKQGLIQGIPFYPSPNYNPRPPGIDIDLVIIHGISLPPEEFGGEDVIDLFMRQLDPKKHPSYADIAQLPVSAHLLIRRDGALVQFVPFELRAWHAGISSFAGIDNCNDYSIGIELEGTDDIPYEKQQYEALIQVLRTLMCYYPSISLDRIVGHDEVSPGRKTDPGAIFDWQHLKQQLCGVTCI